jgi:hypothetical protein
MDSGLLNLRNIPDHGPFTVSPQLKQMDENRKKMGTKCEKEGKLLKE